MDSITICNLALAKIGDQSITSLTDGSMEARFCNLFYPVVVKECLMLNTWGFATTSAVLAQNTTAPSFNWSYSYQLPSDFNKIVAFNNYGYVDMTAVFEIQGTTLLTDETYANIYYVSSTPDPSIFSTTFVEVVALKLASDLCKPLAGDLNLKNQLLQQFKLSIAEAGRIDANQSKPKKVMAWVNSPLVQSRFSGSLP